MERERWAQVKELFDRLVSRPVDEQERVLQGLSAEYLPLRDDLARLLMYARQSAVGMLDGRAYDFIQGGSLEDTPENVGRFRIDQRLGAGGMGVVYRAYDPLRASPVALKTLTRVTPATIALFKREFRSLADVHHPNLVTLFDLFEQDDRWFFTMELLEGLPLTPYLAAAPDRVAAVRHILPGLAEGLSALHRANKLHRDLKPGNIMVTPDGRVVILDFGLIADLVPDNTDDSSFGGTPRYMSPEQARRQPLTAASDAYTLGVVLFEALTGQLPPPAWERRDEEIVIDPARFGFIPDDLAGVCRALLRLRADDRLSPASIEVSLSPGVTLGTEAAQSALPVAARPIVGRDTELDALNSAAATVLSSARPGVATIEGAPGVGKSALVAHWLATAKADPHTLVLESRCYERESISSNVFDSLSDALNRHLRALDAATLQQTLPAGADILGRMFPRLEWLRERTRATTPELDRQQLRRSGCRVLRDLLHRLTNRSRLVVFVDDMQWADRDSVEMLMDLLRGADPPPLLLILAYRGNESARGDALTWLLRELAEVDSVDGQHVSLRPLTDAASMTVASGLLSTLGGYVAASEDVERIVHESGGNPYYIGELVQFALHETTAAPLSIGHVTLTSVVYSRTNRLPAPARRLLDTVVLAGRPISSADALAAALDDDRSPTWLALLRSQRFVRTRATAEEELVEPFHDRLREIIDGRLSDEDRRRGHHALAITLRRSPQSDPELLALHFEGAGELEDAGRYYISAAEQASATLAFNSAAERFDKALAVCAWPVDRQRQIVRSKAEALANAGRTYDAALSYKQAADEDSPEGVRSLSRAGYHFAASGRIDAAKETFTTVHRHLGITVPLQSRLVIPRLLALSAWLAWRRYRFVRREQREIPALDVARIDACWFVGAGLGLVELATGALFTTKALHLALQSGDELRIARGLAWEAAIAASQSPTGKARSRDLFDACREIVERCQDPYCTAMLALCEGLADFSHGRWGAARQRMDRAEQLFTHDCVGVSYELATLNGFKLQTCVYAGALSELRTLAPPLLDAARSSGDLYAATFVRGAIEPLLHLADDRPDLARASVDAALSAWAWPGYHLQHALIDQVRFCIELYDGHDTAARSLVEQQWRLIKASGVLFSQNLRAKLLELRAKCLVASVITSGRSSRDLRGVGRAIGRLEREREPSWRGSVQALRAAVLSLEGRRVGAETTLLGAIDAYRTEGMADHAASAEYQLASWRADVAGQTRAAEQLHREGIQQPHRWARMRVPAPAHGGSR